MPRLNRLYDLIQSNGLDAILLNPSPNLTYLTGLHFHLMERPVVAFFIPGQDPLIVLPELEMGKIAGLDTPFQAFAYGDNPATWHEAFEKAARAANLDSKTIGVEPLHMRLLEYQFLLQAMPHAAFTGVDAQIAALRLQKDASEIEAMRQAAMIAQQALNATLPLVKVGMTELDLARELTLQLFRAGSDPELPFSPIIASGPNSANPHAAPSERALVPGDLIVIDWGASFNGYFSDLTRTFAVQEAHPELANIVKVVLDANAAGRVAGKPGIPAGQVDAAARGVIEAAGYGQYFTHRTGHGLGIETHEEPYMFGENKTLLAPGMVYTVEPGIYVPEVGGARIEDDVVVTERASESLSNMPRDLIVIA